jgi:hypothetical protein
MADAEESVNDVSRLGVALEAALDVVVEAAVLAERGVTDGFASHGVRSHAS